MSGLIIGTFRGLLVLTACAVALASTAVGALALRAWMPSEDSAPTLIAGGLLGLLVGLVVVAVLLGLQFIAVQMNANLELAVRRLEELNVQVRLFREHALGEGTSPGTGAVAQRVEPRL